MAKDQLQMEFDKAESMAEKLATASAILKGVSAVIEQQMHVMQATAFIGQVGGAAVSRFLAILKPKIDAMQKKTELLERMLRAEIARARRL